MALNTVINTAKAKKAWQFASVALAATSIILAISLVKTSSNTKIVVVPYSALHSKQPIKINGQPALDSTYISLLADADIALFLNWTPKTVEQRLDTIKFRLSPVAYAQNFETLKKNVKFYKENSISQVFFPVKKQFIPPNTVRVSGALNRFAGGKVLEPIDVTYSLSYEQTAEGIYVISSIKTEKKQ